MTSLFLASALLAFPPDFSALETEVKAGKFPKLNGMLVERHGKTVYEKSFGDGSPVALNDTRSVTKTVTAYLCGILDPEMDAKSLGAFLKVPADPAWRGTTVKDLLTMSSPIAADDSDGESPGNEDRMHEQKKWLDWALALPIDRRLVRGTGGRYPFRYATVNALLAGQAVEKAAGKRLDRFAEQKLFKPLGVKRWKFQTSPTGEVFTGGGLRLTARDLGKLGRLLLTKGRWGGKQVVPERWIQKMTTVSHKDTAAPGVDYGYFLWRIDFGGPDGQGQAWCMLGNGGNVVAAFPKLDAVVTVTRTDYNSGSTPRETMRLIGELVLPQLAKGR